MLISNFMMSQIGKQIITINILPNISRSKGNQAMKFGQLTKHSVINKFHYISCTKEVTETSSRRRFSFKKDLYTLILIYFDRSQFGHIM